MSDSPTVLTTTINRGWLTKMVIIAMLMFGFGLWGLYDATIAYPARGERAASFWQWQYLTVLDGKADGSLLTKASVTSPADEYTQIKQRQDSGVESPDDRPKLAWLEQLKMIGRLKPEYTRVDDPRKKLDELKTRWNAAGGQNAGAHDLSWYDIPAQWLIVALGVGVGIYMMGLIMVIRGTRYGWEADAQRLHLPSGATLVPADIEVFDKRKWDKFLIFLKIKPSHPQLGGREVPLDLLRFTPLEEWVLAMERTAFPDSEPAPAPAEAPDPAPQNAGS